MTTDTPSSRDEEIPTPRTDEAEQERLHSPTGRYLKVVDVNFARQLERDLIRLSAEREKERPVANRDVPTLFPTLQHEIESLRATLAERDKELADVKKALECEVSERSHLQGELIECNKSTSAEIQELRAQLLAAQTVNGKLREAILTMLETVSMRRLKNYRESAEFLKRRGWTAIPFTPHGAPESVIAHPSHPYQKWEKPGFNKLITDAALKMESKLEMDALAKLVALSSDPTLLDEVVRFIKNCQWGYLPPERFKEAENLLSRLRQSTRETEEKV